MPGRDSITTAIRSIKNTVLENGEYINAELRTKHVMIDPILKALGWDTSNPSQVQMEARLPQTEGIPDYALFKKNAPGRQRPTLGDGRTETTASNGASALQHRPRGTPEDPEWANQMLQASYAATFRVIREMLAAPTPEGGEDHGKSRTP